LHFYGRLTEFKESAKAKASNSHASAYIDTAARELCSKPKCLAQQAVSAVKAQKFEVLPQPKTNGNRQSSKSCIFDNWRLF